MASMQGSVGGMSTAAAARSLPHLAAVITAGDLYGWGVTRSQIRANLAAHRWRRFGRAILLHNHDPTKQDWWDIARVNCGPRSVLTAFTVAEALGLRGYERDEVHVLAPPGTRRPHVDGLRLRLHITKAWSDADVLRPGIHRLAPALVRAASTYRLPRPATGLIAAGVQQRLVRPDDLAAALDAAGRVRHVGLLRLAVADIAQGAEALSELDFVRLCRRHGLPEPELQRVRPDSQGRRRYLDASWRRRDGRLVVVEVDGAVHLVPRVWFDDQLRQNELVLADSLVLRYPSVIVRTEEALVAAQLRRALWL